MLGKWGGTAVLAMLGLCDMAAATTKAMATSLPLQHQMTAGHETMAGHAARAAEMPVAAYPVTRAAPGGAGRGGDDDRGWLPRRDREMRVAVQVAGPVGMPPGRGGIIGTGPGWVPDRILLPMAGVFQAILPCWTCSGVSARARSKPLVSMAANQGRNTARQRNAHRDLHGHGNAKPTPGMMIVGMAGALVLIEAAYLGVIGPVRRVGRRIGGYRRHVLWRRPPPFHVFSRQSPVGVPVRFGPRYRRPLHGLIREAIAPWSQPRRR